MLKRRRRKRVGLRTVSQVVGKGIRVLTILGLVGVYRLMVVELSTHLIGDVVLRVLRDLRHLT